MGKMVTFTIICVMMMTSMSPMMLSFLVTIMSTAIGVILVIYKSASFPASALIISFSTGMMILFCYCALLSNYEMKSKEKNKMMITMMIMSLLLTVEEMEQESTSNLEQMIKSQMSMMLVAMVLVAAVMVSINKSIYKPGKSTMSLY